MSMSFARALSMALLAWTVCVSQGFAAEPTFEARLQKLAEEFERNRVAYHVPGAAIAVVKGDEVVFARGFGLADIEKATPATADTRFFIGSTTKAFTATLVGMLVDDGVMTWDDPVERHLPYFKLAIDSDNEDARATMRDILSHRTGFPRMSMLWASGSLSADEVLHQAAQAEPYAPYRSRFYYNNVMYSAAGSAAAAAGGESWHKLIDKRILNPLGMKNTQTSIREARGGPSVARGYAWNEHLEEFKLHAPGPDSQGVDAVAPAGSISSTALDMGKWLRFLLSEGAVDGKQLVSTEALQQTWSQQINIGGGVGYGMGWMLRDWQGQRMIAHDGAIPGGFSTVVVLLPESDLGFVVLSNSFPSVFPSLFINLVPNTLLGDWPADDASSESEDFGPYLGKYIANFATFSNEVFTVLERDGHLALDVPSQMVYDLNPPDEDGKRQFTLTDTIAVSFERNDAGDVELLKMYQAGMVFEVLREGVEIVPEIDLDELYKYLGSYQSTAPDLQIRTLIQNNRLAIEVAGGPIFDLHVPDDERRWVSRANAEIVVVFNETDSGAITGMSFYRPGGAPVVSLSASGNADTLPSVEEILALRQAAVSNVPAEAIETTQTSGVVRFPQAAVAGTFQTTTAGDDRLRVDIDLGRFGSIQVVLDGDRAWRGTSFDMEPLLELHGDSYEQVRLSHPSRINGDWTAYFDSISVLRADELAGRKVYVVKLQQGEIAPLRLSVDAETGDVLKIETNLIIPGLGGLPVNIVSEDYREVHGLRIAHRSIESNEQTGRTVYEVEDFVVNLDLADDFFVPR